MSLSDFPIAKFNIPISIQKAFDKGKIADSYRKMYIVADKLATAEANRLLAQRRIEYFHSRPGPEETGVGTKPEAIPEITKDVSDYRNQRVDYHMDNMIRMLEMHTKSRQSK